MGGVGPCAHGRAEAVPQALGQLPLLHQVQDHIRSPHLALARACHRPRCRARKRCIGRRGGR